jgi:hypothetical protein
VSARNGILREAAAAALAVPTPDTAEMNSFRNAWEAGQYAAVDAVRRLLVTEAAPTQAAEPVQQAGTCGRALSTGQPCPDHPAAVQEPLVVYRASHDSIVMGLYRTAEAARAHCEAAERRAWSTAHTLTFDWIEDEEDGVAELTVTVDGEDGQATDYVVTALTIADAFDEEADE